MCFFQHKNGLEKNKKTLTQWKSHCEKKEKCFGAKMKNKWEGQFFDLSVSFKCYVVLCHSSAKVWSKQSFLSFFTTHSAISATVYTLKITVHWTVTTTYGYFQLQVTSNHQYRLRFEASLIGSRDGQIRTWLPWEPTNSNSLSTIWATMLRSCYQTYTLTILC